MEKVVVVSKSGVKTRTSRAGRKYLVRYINAQVIGKPYTGYKFTIIPLYSGEWPPIFTFSVLGLPDNIKKKKGEVNEKYDRNMYDRPFREVFWLNVDTSSIVIFGYYSRITKKAMDLTECKFYRDHLEFDDGRIVIPAIDLGFDGFPPIFSKNVLRGEITVQGEFERRLRPVYGEDNEEKWKPVEFYKKGTIRLENSDLSLLERVIVSAEEEKSLKHAIDKLRELIGNGEFISKDKASEILAESGITDQDPDEVLESITLSESYEPWFFRILKDSLHDKTYPIFYSENGFIFRVGDTYVWEVPKYGSATYVFDASKVDIGVLSVTLAEVSKLEILNNPAIGELIGFVRRVIHPRDRDDYEQRNRWLNEVQQKT